MTNILLDFYSKNKHSHLQNKNLNLCDTKKLKESNYLMTKEPKDVSLNRKTSHNSPSTSQSNSFNSNTDFKDFCLKLINENKQGNKKEIQIENEERGRGSRKRENGKSRYKTELCRPFEENGSCKYAEKCQFAHGKHEVRTLVRHPKYKSDLCKTYHTTGLCPYGIRCHFIHNNQERYISNKVILELAERTFKQQSCLLNNQFIASFLNKQQFDNGSLEQLANSLNLKTQLHDINSLVNSNNLHLSPHKQQTMITSPSIHSFSPSSSFNESPLSSPNHLPTHLPTHIPNHLPTHTPTNIPANLPQIHLSNSPIYPPTCPPSHLLNKRTVNNTNHLSSSEQTNIHEFLTEDLLSMKLRLIMNSAGF